MTGVLERYRARVARGELQPDAAQEAVAARLDALVADLAAGGAGRPSLLGRLFGAKPEEAPRGLYVVGDVGRGKTMLMDLFHDAAAVEPKQRVHFHAFMADVHARIHAWRQARKRGEARGDDPIPPVAAAIAAEARLLCFDEFAVTDIADAMILGRLFTALFADRVVVVATSNVEPEDLYRDGLNRTLFLPFIAQLQQKMDTMRLDAARDFRYAKLTEAATWFVPADAEARAALDRAFLSLTGQARGAPERVPLLGREIAVPEAVGDVARFPFAALVEAPLGSVDFLALARRYGTVMVDGIRVMRPAERNVVKRFINLVDTLYDEQVKLVASAEAEPDALYDAPDGREVFEFRRTVSRLVEMRSEQYLALPHGHGKPSGDMGGLADT
ncbi:cell division protein ZapE [Lichenibacterium dinghuense]|uniref:cell division protein ZapE n=1 Tax=Lichenibacterium dinghuense TaxID=2895977 RepID=UPI001EEDED6A|nr:cell division protein ZapE [Lichenibacterium sp. 6Y81]